MAEYIYTERNGIYIIDLQKTVQGIDEAYMFVRETWRTAATVLFVGTKKQAQESIREEAERCGMYFINNRWLGGSLTNFTTIRKRIDRLTELEPHADNGNLRHVLPKKEVPSSSEMEKLKEPRRHQEHAGLPGRLRGRPAQGAHRRAREAAELGIPIVGIVDTNCDPEEVDYVIPGNDDAIRAGNLISKIIANAVLEGLEARDAMQAAAAKAAAEATRAEIAVAKAAEEEEKKKVSSKDAKELEEALAAAPGAEEKT